MPARLCGNALIRAGELVMLRLWRNRDRRSFEPREEGLMLRFRAALGSGCVALGVLGAGSSAARST